MPKKKSRDPNEKPQSERFVETARELEVDESGKDFDRAFRKVVKKQNRSKDPQAD